MSFTERRNLPSNDTKIYAETEQSQVFLSTSPFLSGFLSFPPPLQRIKTKVSSRREWDWSGPWQLTQFALSHGGHDRGLRAEVEAAKTHGSWSNLRRPAEGAMIGGCGPHRERLKVKNSWVTRMKRMGGSSNKKSRRAEGME